MKDTICPAPWHHACVNTSGRLKLCCNSGQTPQHYRYYENFDEYWNGDFLNQVRSELKNNLKPEICKTCWKKEEQGVSSLRQSMIGTLKDHGKYDDFIETVEKGIVPTTPLELDLKLGNYCNLSCRMCSSYSSSTYATEFKKIYEDTGIDYGQNKEEKTYTQGKWYNDPEFEVRIRKQIDNGLQKIKFTGGEPMMVPGCKRTIQYCIDTGRAPDMELALITNGTLITNEWFDLIQKFKHVSLILSVDGIGDTFEYIRHPAKWNVVENVCKQLVQLKPASRMLTFCLQAQNVLQPVNILELCVKYDILPSLISLDTPDYMDVIHIPNDLREEALSRLNKWSVEFLLNSERLDRRYVRFWRNAYNKISKSEYNKSMSDKFVQINKLKDKYKNQSWESTEIAKYYG